ncbi:hypothetical protein J5N97_003282 [Dioscorea zingiberensis]|uniref:Endonuclease/exonuclease/phosphatase domain-containing protein n=1 Tax=Dioscorea zingiberensis TaxID=325984 RepID=A0A9D5D4C6_9LILI|nr:hypothetical protein J5N97_003282 [Dioscorea zingiberensis]
METVKILCWNCRGASNPRTVSRIKSLMKSCQPDLVCLVETRANDNCVIKLCKTFSRCWEWAAIPAQGMSGGIITFWKQEVGMVTPIAHTHSSLHLIISSEKPKQWILSVIYNSQHVHVQKSLWNDLSVFSTFNLPWVILGDFNAILNNEENRGGRFENYAMKSKFFRTFVSTNQLLDLGFYGTPFT